MKQVPEPASLEISTAIGTPPQLKGRGYADTVKKDRARCPGRHAVGDPLLSFLSDAKDLLETLVPYFRAGLESRECCLWLIPEPLTEAKAQSVLRQHLPDGDRYLADGSIEIVSSRKWYLKRGKFSRARVERLWNEKVEQASARGYAGLRANENAFWLHKKQWRRFEEYERTLNDSLAGKSMIVLCSYPIVVCGAAEVLDVARNHHFAIAKRAGKWEIVEWRTPSTSTDRCETLTSRERDVLRLAAEGHTNPQIAQRLSIGIRNGGKLPGESHAKAWSTQSDRLGPVRAPAGASARGNTDARETRRLTLKTIAGRPWTTGSTGPLDDATVRVRLALSRRDFYHSRPREPFNNPTRRIGRDAVKGALDDGAARVAQPSAASDGTSTCSITGTNGVPRIPHQRNVRAVLGSFTSSHPFIAAIQGGNSEDFDRGSVNGSASSPYICVIALGVGTQR